MRFGWSYENEKKQKKINNSTRDGGVHDGGEFFRLPK